MVTDMNKKLTAILPAKQRLITTTLNFLAEQPAKALVIDELIAQCNISTKEFMQIFRDKSHLLQAVCRTFYNDTKSHITHWAMNLSQEWTTRESFEAYLHAIEHYADYRFCQQLHHLMHSQGQIWPNAKRKYAYGFAQLYFDDCWYGPLTHLFSQIMSADKAKELGSNTSQRLHQAALASSQAIDAIMQELLEALPTIYALNCHKPIKDVSNF